MEDFLIYIAKSAAAAGAFYLLYRVLFQHQKHFVFNRIYLPVSLALSFAIPLITFTSVQYIQPAPVETNSFAYLAEATTQPTPGFEMEWFHYLIGIYAFGILGFLLYLVLGHFKAFSIIKKSRLHKLFNINVNVTFKDVHPFSFFNKIVLSDRTLDNPNLAMIVLHEEIHVREKHTLDILFAEILFLFQWFNPFAWLLKDAIKNNLEYKTDHQVTKIIDPLQYQLAMVGLAHKEGVAPFLTALNGSQLKNRIVMMKKKNKNRYALLKQLLVLPLLAVLTMSLSNKEVKTRLVESPKQIKIIVDGETISQNDPRLKSVDFSKGIDGKEVMLALGIEDKVITNTMSFDKNPKEGGVYCIQTSDYEIGTVPEFDKMLNKPVVRVRSDKFTVKGTVENLLGEAIPNARIAIEELAEEFVADGNGNFELELNGIEGPLALIFSAPGYYKNDVIYYGNKNELRVCLVENESKKEHSVFGKITNETGNPIPGVSVIVKGKTTGTITDVSGSYKIELEDEDETLIFSMVGFNKKEVPVAGKEQINVQLAPKTESDDKLKEVVVTGYGALKKEPEPETKDKLDEVEVVGYGKQEKGAEPTEKVLIRIRDSSDKTPLYIVDGKPVADIKEVNPAHIESISVLKGTEATALYGTVGGKNGVILVTTKAGAISDSAASFKIKATENLGNRKPLIMLDGEKYDGEIDNLDPADIQSMHVLKDASSIAPYGEEAKDGVILVNTKSEEITSDLDLRRFIAKRIKYPEKALKANKMGTAQVFVKVNGDGIIYSVSEKKVNNAISIDEVVVVSYAPKPEEILAADDSNDVSKVFATEVKRVMQQLPKLGIQEFKGKTLAISVNFVLQ